MEEKELAISCARGDKEARRELYEQYGSRILALCRRYAANPADAEDLMQDSFIKIFRNIGRFNYTRPGSLYSWMSRVSINLAFDSAKRRRNLTQQLVDVDGLEEVIPDESTYEEEAATVPPEVLSEMIEALPEGYRTVFKLYCIDGLSHKEIGTLLGIKEKSSSASLSRARALLTDAIRQYWKEQEDGVTPEGWSRILSKMRRAKVLGGALLALAILLPVSSLLLWRSARQPSTVIAQAVPSPTITEDPKSFGYAQDDSDTHAPTLTPDSPVHVIPDNSPVITDNLPVILSDSEESGATEEPDTTEEPRPIDYAQGDTGTTVFPADPFQTSLDQSKRKGRRISLSLRAGAGTSNKSAVNPPNSSDYIVALAFMNFVDPSNRLHVKSNFYNTVEWMSFNHTNSASIVITDSWYRHDLPVSLGLSARMDLSSRIGVESGVEYTYLHSTLEYSSSLLEQKLHLIGIPLRVDTRIWSQNGLDLYVGMGAKAEKCISASLGVISCEEKRLQWSAEAFSGVQYRIGPHLHLYLQPELSYYFTKTDLITYRTDNPLSFSLNAGLRFDL